MKTPHPHKKLERSRFSFFLIGLIIALGGAFTAFEWKSYYEPLDPEDFSGCYEDPTWIYPDESPVIRIKQSKTEVALNKKRQIASNDYMKLIDDDEKKITDEDDRSKDKSEEFNPDDINWKYFGVDDETILEPELNYVHDHLSVEVAPSFIHCKELVGDQKRICFEKEVSRQIKQHFRIPPEVINGKGYGAVEVSFVISDKGRIEDVEILQSNNWAMDKEAIRAVKRIKGIIPASQQGHAVPVRMKQPIIVKLSRQD